ARTSAEDIASCHAAGCNAYSPKPLDLDALVNVCLELGRAGSRLPAEGADHPAPAGSQPTTADGPLVSELADDPDFAPLVTAFVADLPRQAASLEQRHRAGDFDALARLAHQ